MPSAVYATFLYSSLCHKFIIARNLISQFDMNCIAFYVQLNYYDSMP